MIQLTVTDQELFELIMALYVVEKSASTAMESGQQPDSEATHARKSLLDKLHDAFDREVIQAALPAGRGGPIRQLGAETHSVRSTIKVPQVNKRRHAEAR